MRTAVLVHGGWHGGWCWSRVTAELNGAGWRVFAPSLTGMGDRVHLCGPSVGAETHVRDIVELIESEELTDVVLVGHSAGGVTIAGVAEAIPERIGSLVFLDAILPESGQSLYGVMEAAGSADQVEILRSATKAF
jgi:pimeloyl-ACP methyl ester carboxylesterase